MAYRNSVEVLRARVARMERERDELRGDVSALGGVGGHGSSWFERFTGGGYRLRISLPLHSELEDADVFDALRALYAIDGSVVNQAEQPTWCATLRLGTTVEARVLRDEQGARVSVRESMLDAAFGPLWLVVVTIGSQTPQAFTHDRSLFALALTGAILGVPAWLGGRVVHRYLVRRRILRLRQLGRRLSAPRAETER